MRLTDSDDRAGLNTWRVLLSLALATAVGIDSASAQLPAFDRVRVLETPRVVGTAVLTDQDGRAFDMRELNSRVSLVLFGFTNCPDVCPIAMESFRQVYESGQLDSTEVFFVMISVDGERDSPEVMKEFLDKFPGDFIGLTETPAAVNTLAQTFSASFFKGTADHEGHYSVAHSPQVFLMDRQGRVRAELYNPTVEATVGITQALLDEGR